MKPFLFFLTSLLVIAFTAAPASAHHLDSVAMKTAIGELSEMGVEIRASTSAYSTLTLAQQIKDQSLTSLKKEQWNKLAEVLSLHQNECSYQTVLSLHETLKTHYSHFKSIEPSLGKMIVDVQMLIEEQFKEYLNVAFPDREKFDAESALGYKLDLFKEPIRQVQIFSYPAEQQYKLATLENIGDKPGSYSDWFDFGIYTKTLVNQGKLNTVTAPACGINAYGVAYLLGKGSEDVKKGYQIPAI